MLRTQRIFAQKQAALTAIFVVLIYPLTVFSQPTSSAPTFKKIKLLVQNGDTFHQKPAIVTFGEDSIEIKSPRGLFDKRFKYADIKHGEYSYSKSPRWKTGLALGAASVVFPPLLLIAIPLGFTKHRRHWVTIRTDDDFAVLKISKKNRKTFIPTLETKAGITVEAVGEEK